MGNIINHVRNYNENECCAVSPVANFWVKSTSCSGESHVVFEHFEHSQKSHFEYFEREVSWSLASSALFTWKLYTAYGIAQCK